MIFQIYVIPRQQFVKMADLADMPSSHPHAIVNLVTRACIVKIVIALHVKANQTQDIIMEVIIAIYQNVREVSCTTLVKYPTAMPLLHAHIDLPSINRRLIMSLL